MNDSVFQRIAVALVELKGTDLAITGGEFDLDAQECKVKDFVVTAYLRSLPEADACQHINDAVAEDTATLLGTLSSDPRQSGGYLLNQLYMILDTDLSDGLRFVVPTVLAEYLDGQWEDSQYEGSKGEAA